MYKHYITGSTAVACFHNRHTCTHTPSSAWVYWFYVNNCKYGRVKKVCKGLQVVHSTSVVKHSQGHGWELCKPVVAI